MRDALCKICNHKNNVGEDVAFTSLAFDSLIKDVNHVVFRQFKFITMDEPNVT